MRDTHKRAAAGEFGELVSISATIREGWSSKYDGQWKQKPEPSGGGFMFDTGALVTFNAAGEGPPGYVSHMTLFYSKSRGNPASRSCGGHPSGESVKIRPQRAAR